MKLFGSSKRGRHASTGSRSTAAPAAATSRSPGTPIARVSNKSKKKKSGRKKAVAISCTILGLVVIVLAATLAIVRWEIQPFYDILFPRPVNLALPRATPTPTAAPHDDPDAVVENAPQDVNEPATPTPSIEELRDMNKITFLILGVDGYKGLRSEGGANTDVVMIATFDMEELTMDVVSIPRDTIVNVPWSVKKVNSIWANMTYRHRGSTDADRLVMEDTKAYFADLLGYNVDFWVRVDMAGFEFLINSLPAGGVRFNVPYRISLVDPDIGLDVSLSPGEQLLNGRQSLAVVRYRGVGGGDFTRVETQGKFLKAAAEQILANAGSINITDYANIFINHVKTDIELNNLVRLGREMLKLKSENVNFYSATAEPYTVSGYGAGSYAAINLDEWLELVNTKLNPFNADITPQDVSILTLGDDRRFYVTDDNWQGSRNWGR